MSDTITIIPGDGIGPEVTAAARRILDAAGADLEYDEQMAGVAALEEVNDPLPEETVASIRRNAVVLKGVSAEEIKERLEADVQEELGHAQQIGQRLDELDERPPASFDFEARQADLQPPEDPTDVLAVIEGVVEAENDAIATYRSLIEAARVADDPVTEDLAVTLLADEESHRAEFKGFRREFES